MRCFYAVIMSDELSWQTFGYFGFTQAIDLNLQGFGTDCMLFNLMGTKTNYDVNKREYGVSVRNRHVDTCVIGSLALYLFLRFSTQSFPSFARSELWFDTPLFVSKFQKAIGYQTHKDAVKDLLEKAEINTTKVTHIGRRGGLGF